MVGEQNGRPSNYRRVLLEIRASPGPTDRQTGFYDGRNNKLGFTGCSLELDRIGGKTLSRQVCPDLKQKSLSAKDRHQRAK
jgi:hypothetical protein